MAETIEGFLKESTTSGWIFIAYGPHGQRSHYIRPGDNVEVKLGSSWVKAEIVPGLGLASNRLMLIVKGSKIVDGTPSRVFE